MKKTKAALSIVAIAATGAIAWQTQPAFADDGTSCGTAPVCCKSCDSALDQDPNKHLSNIDSAAQKEAKPATKTKHKDTNSNLDDTGETHFHWSWTRA